MSSTFSALHPFILIFLNLFFFLSLSLSLSFFMDRCFPSQRLREGGIERERERERKKEREEERKCHGLKCQKVKGFPARQLHRLQDSSNTHIHTYIHIKDINITHMSMQCNHKSHIFKKSLFPRPCTGILSGCHLSLTVRPVHTYTHTQRHAHTMRSGGFPIDAAVCSPEQ